MGKIRQCAFCGAVDAGEDSKLFVRGVVEGIFICADCLETCNSYLHASREAKNDKQKKSRYKLTMRTPAEIKSILDEYVIGQEDAKIALSVAVYNHYKRVFAPSGKDDIELTKSNVLMLGPTGSGKTLLAQVLARTLNVPFAISDATTLTEAGYVGEDVENILLRLLQAADFDINTAKTGIVYVDEIDKISRRGENTSITRDVSGEGVQQALLKIFEGTIASVPPQGGRKFPTQECIQLDTSNILFICGGAFDGLDKIIQKRMSGTSIGFESAVHTKEDNDAAFYLRHCEPHDLVKYGLIPELVGRIPVSVPLERLDKASLMKILSEPKNAIIKQYVKLLEMDGVELVFEEGAIEAIAEKAVEINTGARGLRSIVESAMTEIMYTVPSDKTIKKVIITRDLVENGGAPCYERKQTA